ncbi:MAG: hypothetical protein PWQ55_2091 [Chloroflexota bacterium]|nr:hypothetical protein [Chloroflexota bacterium]
MQDNKILVAFFSRAGGNYVNGRLVDLAVGNTEVAAGLAAKLTGGTLFKIETVRSYSNDYNTCTQEAKQEQRDNARPELAQALDGMGTYSTVILGYPNWWGTAPMAVFTFLEGYDFSGKAILPFCTHEGSRMGRSERDIQAACPQASVLKGLPIIGSSAAQAEKDIADWIASTIKKE